MSSTLMPVDTRPRTGTLSSSSSHSSLASAVLQTEDLAALPTERLLPQAQQLQRDVQRLDRENRRLREACAAYRVLLNKEDDVLEEIMSRRIEVIEARFQAAELDSKEHAYLKDKMERLKKEKQDLEAQLQRDAARITAKLDQEKAFLEEQHRTLNLNSETGHLDGSSSLLTELADEVLRLRALLVAAGRAESMPAAARLEDVTALQQENKSLQRKVRHLQSQVESLTRSQGEMERSYEIDDERQFNLQRTESPLLVPPSSNNSFSGGHPLGFLSSSPSTHGLSCFDSRLPQRAQARVSRPRSGSDASILSNSSFRSGILTPSGLGGHHTPHSSVDYSAMSKFDHA
ncbi:uncharacterized protein MONBRDRAFT_33754 [Monosiga brevicollis MX1]|uniref:Coiled-coil domain-containing protein 6 n=1 Tax=Monosiga brevicollis TaxID=81824 RepID=A9V796_MONBE|nr:uncharacterized protein MONBRDRAFT_33754 [Monosiga brevicollis MX1]EDQ86477.1 predicted protein [Monosiga brevicollis MX1]|eukprot:XP_001748590.1 hypothetical protein [Monosiga brevicollis MX1]